jgi:hypothetical protein
MFFLIPKEILREFVLDYLSDIDMLSLKLTCKFFYKFILKQWLIGHNITHCNEDLIGLKFLRVLYINVIFPHKNLTINKDIKSLYILTVKNNSTIQSISLDAVQKNLRNLCIIDLPRLREMSFDNIPNIRYFYINFCSFANFYLRKWRYLESLVLINFTNYDSTSLYIPEECINISFINISASSYREIVIPRKLEKNVYIQSMNNVKITITTWKENLDWIDLGTEEVKWKFL